MPSQMSPELVELAESLESIFMVCSFLVDVENHLNFPFESWKIILRC